MLQDNIIGYQEFNGRSFTATRDFGLLRNGDIISVELPENPNQFTEVTILNLSKTGFVIQINELTAPVSLDSNSNGIQSSP
jgi:hypothetical protein